MTSEQEKADILKKEQEEFSKDDGEDEAYEPDYDDGEDVDALQDVKQLEEQQTSDDQVPPGMLKASQR